MATTGFGADWDELEIEGASIIEVLEAFVGQCQECGRPAEEQAEGSVLVNLVNLGGTIYGDTFRVGCVTDVVEGRFIQLPPLPGWHRRARGGRLT